MTDLSLDTAKELKIGLTKERDEFMSAINQLNAALARHRDGLQRTEGALFVVERIIAAGEAEAPEHRAVRPKGRRAK